MNYDCSNLLDIRNLKLKKYSVTKIFSDLSLFEWIVLVISKFSLQFQKFWQKFFWVTRTNSRPEQVTQIYGLYFFLCILKNEIFLTSEAPQLLFSSYRAKYLMLCWYGHNFERFREYSKIVPLMISQSDLLFSWLNFCKIAHTSTTEKSLENAALLLQ